MKRFKELLNVKEINNIALTGLTDELTSFCVDNIYKSSNRDILILTNSLYEANMLYSALSNKNDNTLLFPMDDFLTTEALACSPDLLSIRLNTLNELLNDEKHIVITNLMGLLRYLPTKEMWKTNNIVLKYGEEIDRNELVNKLITMGYKNEDIVTSSGEFSSRGFILDIFPISSDSAIRIEFWGDQIDSIRYFNVDTQRSLDEIKEIEISPYSEFMNEKGIDIEPKQKYLPLCVDKVSSIFDYLDNPITIIKDYNDIENSYTMLKDEIYEYDKSLEDPNKTNYMFNLEDIKFKDEIYLLSVDNIINKKLDKTYDFKSKNVNDFKSNYNLLNEYITTSLLNKKTIIISLNSDIKINSLKKYLNLEFHLTDIDNIYDNELNVIKMELNEGFEINDYIFISEKELYGTKVNKVNYKNKFKAGTKVKLNNLEKGDYVVHINHGIGRYEGIKTISNHGNMKDYLEITYHE